MPVRLEAPDLDRVRSQVLRQHQRNLATAAAQAALGEAAWSSLGITGDRDAKAEFLDKWEDHLDVEAFMAAWWPQVDPREVLPWLADTDLVRRHGRGVLDDRAVDLLAASFRLALGGRHLVGRRRRPHRRPVRQGRPGAGRTPRGARFYEIEELEDLSQYGVTEVQPVSATRETRAEVVPEDPRERLLAGRIGKPDEYAHVLVDEAQDLSPMQWRMIGRRGRHASWTVVGDAAQASWTDAEEARAARDEAFGKQQRRGFHMATNYRNAREIFDYAAAIIRREVPDADIPEAVRETGHDVVEGSLGRDALGSVRGPSMPWSSRWRARSPSSLRSGMPLSWLRSTARPTGGSRSSTRCRPRASSTTPSSLSTRVRSPGSPRRHSGALRRADARAHRMTVLS